MWIFGCYCLPDVQRLNPLWWLFISITFLYLFQSNSGLWYSITGGLNYLYPIPLTVLFLILFRRYENKRILNLATIFLASSVGFITGCSQECYSLPLSGGVFILLTTNLIQRRKISTSRWILALSLWIGTLILVVAPGNFIRLNSSPRGVATFINGLKLLLGTRLFWLVIIALIALLTSCKKRFYDFIRNNSILFLTLTIAICFGMTANTLPQSFNGISFYCALILFRLTSVIAPFKNKSIKFCAAASILGFILLSIHQIRIINGCMAVEKTHKEFIQNYIASPDGIVEMPTIILAKDVKPFVKIWFDSSEVKWWLWYTLNAYYMHGEKQLSVLDKTDYKAYRQHETSSLKKVSDGVYLGASYLWFEPSHTPKEGDSIIVFNERPISLFTKVRYKVFGNKMPISSSITIRVDSTTIIGMDEGLHGIKIGADKVVELRINNNMYNM